MFLEYFRLREQPFGVTPDPRYLFPSPGHREALASLIYGIESNLGFGSLIAEPGMGKTTLLFHILEQYRQSASTAFIFNTQCNSNELLRSLLSELDDQPAPEETFQLHERFKQILAAKAQEHRRVILMIDEAQNLGDMAMETVRLLSNFESANCKLLYIVLAGQPELATKLGRPELNQLLQRIPILASLPQLSTKEIALYVEHRMYVAGYRGHSLFTHQAMGRIAWLSRGVPREINRLCFNCLSLAYASSKPMVDLPVVEEVAADLDLNQWLGKKENVTTQKASMGVSPQVALGAAANSSQPAQSPSQAELPAPEGLKRAPNPIAPTFAAKSLGRRRLTVHDPQNSIAAQLPASLRRSPFSLSRGWATYQRPVAFALCYLTLIAWAWALTQWRSANPPAATVPAIAKTASEAAAGQEVLPTNKVDSHTIQVAASHGTKPVIKHPGKRFASPSTRPSYAVKPQGPDTPGLTGFQSKFDLPLAGRADSAGPPPELVKYAQPMYPDIAWSRYTEGTVVLSAVVTRDGTVKSIKPVRGDPMLLKAAESAVRHWLYRPYRINGKPVDVKTEIVIGFSLPQERDPYSPFSEPKRAPE
jgi:TonB family protein